MDFQRFKTVFVDQFIDEDETKVTGTTKFRELSSWDSLTGMAIIAAIEDEYAVKIDAQDFKQFITLDDAFEFVKQRAK